MYEVREVTPAVPAPTGHQEVAQLLVLGSLARTMRARFRGPQDVVAHQRLG